MGEVRRDPNRPPTHPGALLRDITLPATGMTVVDVAKARKGSRQTLHRILSEKGPVTPEMAIRIGKFCGNGPGFWLWMQQAYDLWHAERKLAGEIAMIPTAKDAA